MQACRPSFLCGAQSSLRIARDMTRSESDGARPVRQLRRRFRYFARTRSISASRPFRFLCQTVTITAPASISNPTHSGMSGMFTSRGTIRHFVGIGNHTAIPIVFRTSDVFMISDPFSRFALMSAMACSSSAMSLRADDMHTFLPWRFSSRTASRSISWPS